MSFFTSIISDNKDRLRTETLSPGVLQNNVVNPEHHNAPSEQVFSDELSFNAAAKQVEKTVTDNSMGLTDNTEIHSSGIASLIDYVDDSTESRSNKLTAPILRTEKTEQQFESHSTLNKPEETDVLDINNRKITVNDDQIVLDTANDGLKSTSLDNLSVDKAAVPDIVVPDIENEALSLSKDAGGDAVEALAEQPFSSLQHEISDQTVVKQKSKAEDSTVIKSADKIAAVSGMDDRHTSMPLSFTQNRSDNHVSTVTERDINRSEHRPQKKTVQYDAFQHNNKLSHRDSLKNDSHVVANIKQNKQASGVPGDSSPSVETDLQQVQKQLNRDLQTFESQLKEQLSETLKENRNSSELTDNTAATKSDITTPESVAIHPEPQVTQVKLEPSENNKTYDKGENKPQVTIGKLDIIVSAKGVDKIRSRRPSRHNAASSRSIYLAGL